MSARVVGRAYKRGPSEAERSWGVVLIEVVEKVEGMRGRRRDAVYGSRIWMRALWRPLDGVDRMGLSPEGSTRDELESLILAQNERWRHA